MVSPTKGSRESRGTKVMIKRAAALAAMTIFAGTMISGAVPARAYYHNYQDYMYLKYPSGTLQRNGTFWIDADFTDYGRHVGLNFVSINNPNSYPITIDVFRWQASDGYPFYRGPGYVIAPHTFRTWILDPWVPSVLWSENPYVHVRVHDNYNSNV